MKKKDLKKEFLTRYKDSCGHIANTAIALGIHRTTYYNWLDSDPDFKKAIEALDMSFVENVETEIWKKIKSGDSYWMMKWLTIGPGRVAKDRWIEPKKEPTELAGSIKLEVERKIIE